MENAKTQYHGEGKEDESNFTGVDLNNSVRLPEVNTNVQVDIPRETFVWLGLALFVNVLFFWGLYYVAKTATSKEKD